MNDSSSACPRLSAGVTSLLAAICLGAIACAASAPEATPAPAEPQPVALPAVAPPPPASAASETSEPTPAPGASSASPAAGTNRVPNWTHNGSDTNTGDMVLRCENAFPPEDQSGKCRCEGYELNVCVDGIRRLTIDRKQCGFICKPTSQNARKIAIRCPDRSNPTVSAKGCECSGRKPLDPCAGGIASAELIAGECVVTCKKDQ